MTPRRNPVPQFALRCAHAKTHLLGHRVVVIDREQPGDAAGTGYGIDLHHPGCRGGSVREASMYTVT